MIRILRGLVAALTVTALSACGGDDSSPPGNVAAVADSQGLTALGAAVNKAGLAPTLTDANASLTVFAPTNAAFDTLATRRGFADATAMVSALPASTLAKILSYHVLGTRKTAADLVAGGTTEATVYSFAGAPATLAIGTTGGVTITDAVLTSARVTTADVAASNGVVHVIDKVLIPPGVLDIVQIARVNPAFSSLVDAVVNANLQGTLSAAGPFTVFAPTDDAFAAIAPTVAGLTTPQLTTVLAYHVLSGQVLASQIPFGTPIDTVAGQKITVNSSPPTIADTTAAPAPILATDVRASNGVIHVIGKVLLPSL